MTEYVSINIHTIRGNFKNGTEEPPIRIARKLNDKDPRYALEIKINEPCRLVYSPHEPILGCGARLVIEAPDGSVEIVR